jgi:DNA polymerase-3 subunit delta
MSTRSPKSDAAASSQRPGKVKIVALTPAEFDRAIKNGAAGAYLFFGEEEYLARVYADRLRDAVLGDGDIVMDRVVLDDETYTPQALADEIGILPMLGDRRLVEVRGVDFSRAGAVEDLCLALEGLPNSPHSVVLVVALGELFDGGDERRPSKALAAISAVATPVRFARQTPARLAGWVARHFAAEGAVVSREVCDELVAFAGRDMTTLAGEIKKLSAYVLAQGRAEVTHNDIRRVCSGAVELDSFALANAVLRGDTDTALQTLSELLARRERPEILLAQVTRVFCDLYAVRMCVDAGMDKRAVAAALKMHEYKAGLYVSACKNRSAEALARAVEICRKADLKLKSTPVPDDVILARLAASKL